ncbi:MAG: glycosyltransferase [Bacteroidia bacterium]|nr:glycosyltransferase [Bacteroidia bacterium]
MLSKENLIQYFDELSYKRFKWKKRNRFYHRMLEKYFSFFIPKHSNVIEIGCGTGELLNHIKPSYAMGIDFSEKMINIAKQKYPQHTFLVNDAENITINKKFDYIIVSDLLTSLWDVQKAFADLRKICHRNTKIVISTYNNLWELILKFAEFLGQKSKQPLQNWLSISDINNLLHLEGFEIIKKDYKVLFPINIPIIGYIFNRILSNLPFINKLCLIQFVIARPIEASIDEYSVSILIPARNERGNIENAILRTPKFGKTIEYIFIEGNSQDNTWDEILRVKEKYKDLNIVAVKQSGKGKGNAVREGFDIATGDMLMILDADLTTPPDELPKFYKALAENKGEFINGCRLVYPMEKQAMRFFNLLGNLFFSAFLSFILGQRLKDTLCGTKVLFKKDYEIIKNNRAYFGDFDPFGDFDLLFGAAKLNLKIVEIIVRYKERQYGATQISRFKHGLILLKMSFFAAKKIKFI